MYATEQSTIKKICDGLNRYYESLDKDYDKLFTNYCDDNGFDTDLVIEEIFNDPMENMLIDFDDEFPFAIPPESNVAKTQQILGIIQNIYHNPNIAFDVQMPQFNRALFNITEKDIQEIRNIYKKQCPVIYEVIRRSCLIYNDTILCMLAIGRKNKIDYLQHLVDDYSFSRMEKFPETDISEERWSSDHNHFRLLKKIKGVLKRKGYVEHSICDIPIHAVTGYGKTIGPKWFVSGMVEINECLETVIKYIHAVVSFVCNLISTKYISNDSNICPFQVDLCIATGAPNQIDNVGIPSRKIVTKKEFIDYIGNIKQKLEENKLTYILQNDIDIKSKLFDEMFDSFVNKLTKSEDKIHKKKNTYPFKKRFIIFIDRREIDDEKKYSGDSIWMYEPPNNCRTIPNNAVPEWYINSSRTCLLPDIKDDDDSNINSLTCCEGELLTISFIVPEVDTIKMYLYWYGRTIRLRPKHIKTVLTFIFNMQWNNNSNQLYAENKEIDKLIKEIQQKVYDKYYESFVSCCTNFD